MSKASRLRKAGKHNDSETQTSIEEGEVATEAVDPVAEVPEVAIEEIAEDVAESSE